MDQKVTSNGNLQVIVVPVSAIADYRSPTEAELNGPDALDITDAIAWEGTTFPTASESEDINDRSLRDRGNATTRGSIQFEATLNFFYPRVLNETQSDYGKAYNYFRVPRVPTYIITRVLQGPEGEYSPFEAGQWISVYNFLSDGWADDVSGDESYKYEIGFLPQGEAAIYTQVRNTDPITIDAEETALAPGEVAALVAEMGGHSATQTVNWTSSAPSVATVSQNGVVRANAVGTATITASHPAAPSATETITVA